MAIMRESCRTESMEIMCDRINGNHMAQNKWESCLTIAAQHNNRVKNNCPSACYASMCGSGEVTPPVLNLGTIDWSSSCVGRFTNKCLYPSKRGPDITARLEV